MANERQFPLVSAIITTLQRPQLVTRAIQSVFRQTYPNIELIVIVDGPDLDTIATLEHLSDARLRVVALPENVGPSEARNTGVRVAEGEWIAFLDDDDEWLPEKIAVQLEAGVRSGEETNFVVCRYEERGNDGIRFRPKRFPSPGEDWGFFFYRHAGILLPSTFLVKRSIMLELPLAKNLRRTEDVDWCLRAQAAGVLHPQWVDDGLTIYHNEITRPRLSSHSEWQSQYEWILDNPSLLTRDAIPYYIGMICIPEAKQSSHPLRACSFLLKQAVVRGRLSIHAVAYLIMVTFSSRKWRGNVRRRFSVLQRRSSWQKTTTVP